MYDQAAAAQILVDGMDLFESGSSSPTPSPTPTSTPAPTPTTTLKPELGSHSRVGVIVGTTIGVVVFLLLLGVTIAFLRRHRGLRTREPSEATRRTPITPFHGEKSEQGSPRPSQWRTKDQSGVPIPLNSGAGLSPLIVPTPSSDPSNEHLGLSNSRSEVGPDMTQSREDGREGAATQMELVPGFPDMVRAVYRRLWEHEHDESGNPPDYRSNAEV
ncbi:hypothetical protein V5O48_014314 [Marasmius crinis-equi]|uniref:Uncharacterized protein n=1 Tax=Marasmius crinis-equi TaxID=585013 RepID=A0ABR3EXN2_9AGAR